MATCEESRGPVLKQLFVLSLLTVLLTMSSGCSDSVSKSGRAQTEPTSDVKPADRSSRDPTASQVEEKKSVAAPGNSGTSTSTPSAEATPKVPASSGSETTKDSTPSAEPAKSSTPAKSNEVYKITFDDLNCGMQPDIVFRPWMLTNRVKELDGQQIRIVGYMNPDVKQRGITEFILLRNTECKFGPSGQADHLIRVKLDPGISTNFSSKPVQVIGKLIVNPFDGPDGKTWCIFDMTGQSVGPPQR